MHYDSIWRTAKDSALLNVPGFSQPRVDVPDHTVPMKVFEQGVGGDDYVVMGLVLMFFVLAVTFYKYRTAMFNRLKDFFATKRMYVDVASGDLGSESWYIFLLTSVGAISATIILMSHRVSEHGVNEWEGMPYWMFGAGYVIYMALVYAKAWLYVLVNWTFFDRENGKRWMAGYLLMTAVVPLLFYPIALMEVFAHASYEMVTTCGILVVILYEMLLFYKTLLNFKMKKYGYLLNILYFCSVELMPALVVGHLIRCFE
jgi:hypothetical protein